MTTHPEERRIAGLLQELISRSGAAVAQLEESLGWQPGRLAEALDSPGRIMLSETLVLLPLLRTTLGEFFARFDGLEVHASRGPRVEDSQTYDTRFEESRQVVQGAMARRAAWKSERSSQ